MFSCGLDCGHIQRDTEGGNAQLVALFVGVNPEVLTPESSIDTTPWVLDGDLSMHS